tara:strand:+ start:14638 stop:15171 length:534 start_codon:yes stop_codon:yes gene_type:complete
MAVTPPVLIQPYSDSSAMLVLSRLDPMDHIEAEQFRGRHVDRLELFADWRAMNAARVVSLVLCTGSEAAPIPFAVLGLSLTGQAGVAQAALLARNHVKFRRPLITAGAEIRGRLPAFCEENNIYRIEVRSWGGHPRAARFLTLCGFQHEIEMPGFGGASGTTFHQFAWTQATTEKEI